MSERYEVMGLAVGSKEYFAAERLALKVGDEQVPHAAQQTVCETKRAVAHKKLREAESAWYKYFGECEVGPERAYASDVYERIRQATRRY